MGELLFSETVTFWLMSTNNIMNRNILYITKSSKKFGEIASFSLLLFFLSADSCSRNYKMHKRTMSNRFSAIHAHISPGKNIGEKSGNAEKKTGTREKLSIRS